MESEKDRKAEKLDNIELTSLSIHLLQQQKHRWGKTQSEKLIYWAAIGTWFVPIGIGLHKIIYPLITHP
jgi:hypothetical protein